MSKWYVPIEIATATVRNQNLSKLSTFCYVEVKAKHPMLKKETSYGTTLLLLNLYVIVVKHSPFTTYDCSPMCLMCYLNKFLIAYGM